MFNIQMRHPFAFKRALNVGVCVAIAFILNQYFSFSHEYWMTLSALLVCQTTRGTPARQSLVIFMAIFFAINLATLLSIYVKPPQIIYFILSLLFVCSGYFAFINRPQANRIYFFACSFFMVVLVATLASISSFELTRLRIFDVVIGALIGIASHFILFPTKLDKEFAAGIVPILQALDRFSQTLTSGFFSYEQKQEVINKKNLIEMTLQSQEGVYPEWVYEIGFNRGLRSGFRFFLVNLERVIELLFSINFLFSRQVNPVSMDDIQDAFARVMQTNQELLTILILYFKENKLNEIKSDFMSDMTELEKALNQIVPNNLELLAVTPNNLLLTALVRDMRDLRELLLQLVKSLPEAHV
jgi:hypothetical protein